MDGATVFILDALRGGSAVSVCTSAYSPPRRLSTLAYERHLGTIRFELLSPVAHAAGELECWPHGPPADLYDDFVFHATRFPAYCARLSGDDDGDFHETVWRVAHVAAGEFFVPFWYDREWQSPPGSRASKTARNIARWCLEADEGRLAWMRGQVWFEPWICIYARASVRKSLVRHAAPALARSGLTQVRIARALRCSQGTVSKVLARARSSSPGICPPSTAPPRWTPEHERRLLDVWESRGTTEEELLEALTEEFDRSAHAIRAKYYRLKRSRARS